MSAIAIEHTAATHLVVLSTHTKVAFLFPIKRELQISTKPINLWRWTV